MSESQESVEIFVEGDMKKVASETLNVGDCAYYTHSSPDKSTGNEDGIGILQLDQNTAALIVADGLGGHRSGQEASKAAIKSLFKALRHHQADDSLRATVMTGLEQANHNVIDIGGGAATTVISAMIYDNMVRVYHVGDSGGFLIGQRGLEKIRTVAHSPVGQAEASGLINEEEALAHENRHLVSNVLGSAEMRIEVGPAIKLARYDTLLLASDGLLDNLRTAEIIAAVRKGKLKKIAAHLVEVINQRMDALGESQPSKPDDLSFILYRRNR